LFSQSNEFKIKHVNLLTARAIYIDSQSPNFLWG